eukprot:364509-Chlamydomonas_euryale.AAC.10
MSCPDTPRGTPHAGLAGDLAVSAGGRVLLRRMHQPCRCEGSDVRPGGRLECKSKGDLLSLAAIGGDPDLPCCCRVLAQVVDECGNQAVYPFFACTGWRDTNGDGVPDAVPFFGATYNCLDDFSYPPPGGIPGLF